MAKPLWLFGLLLFCGSLFAAIPRVITLAPHLTEMAFAAGITPVAVSDWSDYPSVAKTLEQVANWQGIKVEHILALKPDVVLARRGNNLQRQIDQLQQLGVNVHWIDPSSLEQMADAVPSLGRWSLQPQMVLDAALPLVPVFLQFGQQPLFTAARAILQNDIIALCAGKNIFSGSRVSWPQVSREQVLMRHPQAIIIRGSTAQAQNVARFWQPQLTVPVIVINDDWLSRPGPRMLLAAKQLCAALHPAQ